MFKRYFFSLGGVAGALNIPGLSTIVERIIREQVRKKCFLSLPNPLQNTSLSHFHFMSTFALFVGKESFLKSLKHK